ncbi:hypothetical protein MHYP_G00318990 [Metynnis hypsauchen]
MDSCVVLILLSSTLSLITADTVVRLVDGDSRCAGRVEIFHDDQWGTVCDYNWNISDAAVVCRELGCGEAVDALSTAHFGPGSGPVWMDDVNCSGLESTLMNCTFREWGESYCSHDEDAGVICSGGVKLVGGSRCSGRVEVLHGETWSTVCDVDFDQQDAEVVCRELGCGLPVEVLGAAAFGRGEGQVWSAELQCRENESEISFCPTTSSLNHNCTHDSDVGLVCAVSVRLMDGGSRCAGRVEILQRGEWGTVCDDGWDMRDAAVVCRELGCGQAVDALSDAYFGPGSGPIWMNNTSCSGSESTLKNCRSAGWGKHNCGHSKDAGVVCSEVRLVGGSHCSGRVEVLHGETWSTVCDADFDQQDAEVVCRELGCGLPVEMLGAAAFGRGEGQVWSEELQCRGNESQIHFCPTSSLKHNCSHDSDVGLVCSVSVRLVDGGRQCAGRVEVLHRGQWGTVCDDGWDMREAAVVCRELGCGEPVDAPSDTHFGPGSGIIWMKDVDCSGLEITVKNCKSPGWSRNDCVHSNDSGVICSEVKLVGDSRCSGRVEVLHGETWSTVCDADFDQQDAEVVCRELGCGLPVEVLGAGAFGRGEGQVWSEELQCRGNESQIHFCPSSSLKHNCSHDSDVGLVCAGHRTSRLTGGFHLCSGRVEVLNGKTWSTVCDAGFDQQDAEVVCRELGCGLPVEVLGAAAFGRGEGQVWSEELQCRGNEFHVSFCPTSSSNNCTHDNDVGLLCAGYTQARLANGSDSCSGRVELQYLSEWGTVCDVSWDMRAASVLCGQLKCGSAVAVLGSDWFGEGSDRIWADVFDCQGNEIHLSKCPISSWSRTACSHEQDAGVICSGSSLALNEGRVRLSGGMECEGEVEVYFRQDWRRVLLDFWKFKEFRLTEGCEGNLEVFYNGTWGNVCLNGMDEETVSLICQELNCGRSGSESWAKARVESAPNWLDNLKCRSHDSTLWQCPSSPWRQNNCDKDNEVAWITCSEVENDRVLRSHLKCSSSDHHRQCSNHLPLRLRGGNGSCSGRLEVYHNTEWGSVCDNQWDIRDAQVVCRQLGCGPVLSADGSAAFGAGEGPIWLNRVKCRGNEIHLWDCPHSLKDHTDCSHRQDAGVTCADISTTPLVITATTSNTTAGQAVKGANTSPQTLPEAVPSIYPVSLLVLGAVLFLALVLLVVLFNRNRGLRRVLSKRRHTTLTEAVYEEIERRFNTKRNDSTRRAKSLPGVNAEYYDDVTTSGLISETAKEDTAESYDDVITAGQISDSEAEDVAESYDDVITADQSSAAVTEDMTDIYDDAVTAGPNSNIITADTPENYEELSSLLDRT